MKAGGIVLALVLGLSGAGCTSVTGSWAEEQDQRWEHLLVYMDREESQTKAKTLGADGW